MLNFAAIFIGGGFGAILRYSTGLLFKYLNLNSYFSTFLVNIVGCFLIGFLGSYFLSKPQLQPHLKLLLTVGFCGGLTTFSTFSAENFEFLKSGRYQEFFIYILLSFLFSIIMTALGVYCANKI